MTLRVARAHEKRFGLMRLALSHIFAVIFGVFSVRRSVLI
jgi:hypothetical protein